jgi:Uma2 family endonuclease
MARNGVFGYSGSMSALIEPAPPLPREKMTVDEFLAWSESREGRHELVDGVVYAQASERAAHAEMKLAVAVALRDAIRRAGAPCRTLPDGMAVRVAARTVFEPDAMIYCGPKLPPDTIFVPNPMIVVEVISPTTGRNDHTRKVAGYFLIESVTHYLIVDPDDKLIVHHQRGTDGVILTHVIKQGMVKLDPPGVEFSLDALYDEA